MNVDEHKKLMGFYKSLSEQKRFFDTLKGGTRIRVISVRPCLNEIKHIQNEYPDLVPFDVDYYGRLQGSQYIDYIAFRSNLAKVITRLESEIDQTADISVTEKLQFPFIVDSTLRSIVERDYEEIQKASISNCYKSVIILCGGTIEAILTDVLLKNKPQATSSESAPRIKDISRWTFSDLIDVVVELNLVTVGVQKLSHPLREYRNIIHPSYEIRNHLQFGAEEAKIALAMLHIVHRDLSH